jgi:hypothetical protein
MMTFLQFLDEQEKRVKLFGMGTNHAPNKLVRLVKPATPAKPVYTGMAVHQAFPVPRVGKPVAGIVMKRVKT